MLGSEGPEGTRPRGGGRDRGVMRQSVSRREDVCRRPSLLPLKPMMTISLLPAERKKNYAVGGTYLALLWGRPGGEWSTCWSPAGAVSCLRRAFAQTLFLGLHVSHLGTTKQGPLFTRLRADARPSVWLQSLFSILQRLRAGSLGHLCVI